MTGRIWMRITLATIAVVLVGAGAWWWRTVEQGTGSMSSQLSLTSEPLPAPPAVPPRDAFAGSAQCQSCHVAQFAAWQSSTHGNAGGVPSVAVSTDATTTDADDGPNHRARVIAPFNGTPLRFKDAVVIPRLRNGEFSFLVQRPYEQDTTLTIAAVIGGGHMEGGGTQGFVTTWSDGTLRFLPFDWSKHSQTWFCHTGTRLDRGWVPITPSLRLADCGDWPPTRVLGDEPRFSNCQSCHGSQIDVAFDQSSKQWKTQANGFAINCESCHGPAANHVALMQSGKPPTADIGLVALATVNKDQSVDVCMTCHALKVRLATGYVTGADFSQFYSVRLSQLGDHPFTPDGRTRTFAYQEGHLASACYRNGNMTCTSCHDPHSQHYRSAVGEALPGRTDDRQCTSCHASKVDNVTAHTKHAAESAGSRCVACHMSYQQQRELGHAIRYARSDHSIAIPRPALDSTFAITSACRTCHTTKSETQLAAQSTAWWGTMKPHEDAVAGLIQAARVTSASTAWPLLLQPSSANATAQVAGLTEWLERYAQPDMAALPDSAELALRALAASSELDVRALALASLHWSAGNVQNTRQFLRRQLTSTDRATVVALRRRWLAVLGGLGDGARVAGDYTKAKLAYQKALEIAPNDAMVMNGLGLTLAALNDFAAAVSTYRISLSVNPWQPMTEVNLGIALEQAGDATDAKSAYARALAADPTMALGYLNMGTALLRGEDAFGAIPYFEKALSRDPSLAVGHFQLALAYLKVGELTKAESSVRRSLAMDPGGIEPQRLLQALVAEKRRK